jgi:hypothetical protein
MMTMMLLMLLLLFVATFFDGMTENEYRIRMNELQDLIRLSPDNTLQIMPINGNDDDDNNIDVRC